MAPKVSEHFELKYTLATIPFLLGYNLGCWVDHKVGGCLRGGPRSQR